MRRDREAESDLRSLRGESGPSCNSGRAKEEVSEPPGGRARHDAALSFSSDDRALPRSRGRGTPQLWCLRAAFPLHFCCISFPPVLGDAHGAPKTYRNTGKTTRRARRSCAAPPAWTRASHSHSPGQQQRGPPSRSQDPKTHDYLLFNCLQCGITQSAQRATHASRPRGTLSAPGSPVVR